MITHAGASRFTHLPEDRCADFLRRKRVAGRPGVVRPLEGNDPSARIPRYAADDIWTPNHGLDKCIIVAEGAIGPFEGLSSLIDKGSVPSVGNAGLASTLELSGEGRNSRSSLGT